MVADPASNANFDQCRIKHIALKWNLSFDKKTIAGVATYEVEFVKKECTQIILDGKVLHIIKVLLDHKEASFKVEEVGEIFGQKIIIICPAGLRSCTLEITYVTDPDAPALQWLAAEQTADKKAPYVFGQCQAIYARSILPCMDTPTVKQTYEAEVTIPAGLTCLMSALADDNGTGSGTEGADNTFRFRQPIPVPSYLIAVVAGLLERREISSRCAVWAEPSIVDKVCSGMVMSMVQARYEFDEAEKMVAAAEAIVGKYQWTRYDMVVMPPSFPYGGMENPCLTFVTPTLLAGDRSMANVIAHEIAHSWTGNLVTNANWEHFWLNEGFTVFLERKILGHLFGEGMRQFASQCGWEDRLIPEIFERLSETHEYTKLIQCHKGIDPDDAYTTIPYEKGSALLLYIEQLLELPLPAGLGPFLTEYAKKFAGESIVSEQWKQYLYEYFKDRKELLDSIDWNGWLYGPGMPPAKIRFDESMMMSCKNLSKRWIELSDEELKDFNDGGEFRRYESDRKIKVLDGILHAAPLSHAKLVRLDQLYELSKSGNCEILFTWLRICIKARWEQCISKALEFVSSQGRLKYVRPIYTDFLGWKDQRATIVKQYEMDRSKMHPITAGILGKLIQSK